MNGTRDMAGRPPILVPHVLVIEDEVIIARDIQLRLKSFGFVVPPPLGSGADALKSIAEHAPDLVLMDIRIRGDIDGVETAALIRDRFGTPIVYLTSHSDEATLQRAKATGAYGFVLKPFKDRDLRIAIEVALQKHQIDRHQFERERWFATTLRAIGDAVIATDSEQRITFMNQVAERVTGWASGDAVGKPLCEVVGLSTRGGARGSVDNSTVPIVDDHGKTLGGVVVFRDMTAQRRLEERAAQNDRLAAIGALSTGMAHEIDNRLTYLLANVASAVASLERIDARVGALPGAEAARLSCDVAAVREALALAHDGGRRVHQIVHDLKKFGRLDGGEHVIVELTDGGEITLENPAGGGASFRISLPPAQRRDSARAAPPAPLAQRRPCAGSSQTTSAATDARLRRPRS